MKLGAGARAGLEKSRNFVFVFYVISLATAMSGMEIFSSLLAILVFASLWLDPPADFRWKRPPFLIPLTLFVGFVTLSILLGEASWAQKRYDISRSRFFLIYLVLFFQLRYFTQTRTWIKVLAITTAVVSGYAFFQHFMPLDLIRPEGKKVYLYANPDAKTGPLVVGLFNHHLTFASIFLMYGCLFLSQGFAQFRHRWASLSLGLFIMLLCFWSGSRAAWIAIPFTILVISLARGKWLALLFFLIGVAIVGIGYRFDDGLASRLRKTFENTQNSTLNLGERRYLWLAHWDIFKEHPLLGVGLNQNERISQKYVDKRAAHAKDYAMAGHAHSTPLQLLAGTGILGTLAYLVLWIAIFSAAIKSLSRAIPWTQEDWLTLGVVAAFVGFHIQSLTQWNFGDAEVLHNLMFLWAYLAARTSLSADRQVYSK